MDRQQKQKINGNQKRVRLQTYPTKEIFDHIAIQLAQTLTQKQEALKGRSGQLKLYYTDASGNRMSVRRAIVFYKKGLACRCGQCGHFFALEKAHDNSLHLDLYGIDKDGDEVLMTIDHIIPKSKGGKDLLENYQPMCYPCNQNKWDKIE